MSDQDQMVADFCAVAGTTEERARFFLESAAWQLPMALGSFYDTGAGAAPEQAEVPDILEAMDTDYQPPPQEEPEIRSSSSTQKVTTRGKPSSKFGSIKDFKEAEQKSDDDEEEGQRYYAGGSEHSGELIVGPPRKNKDITKDLFEEAKKHGAKQVDPGHQEGPKSKAAKSYFSGGGYKLGESEGASEFVPGENQQQEAQPVNIVLKLWSNGFTVDDGPLREFTDSANEEFLNSIKKGEIPQELLKGARRGEVHVDMEDHRNDEYKAPKKVIKAFTGQGHMLGSPAPTVTFDPSSSSSRSSSVDPPVVCDPSQPTTRLQIRMADGNRVVQQFNHDHRISDVRSFLLGKFPQLSERAFALMTTFPNKELTDEALTLSEAKLLNASIVQKFK